MKKSLVISDKEKYGPSSPEVSLGKGKPEDRKSAPTIELTGKQVDAFCACSLNVGDSGTAKIHYVVKASSAGDQYGNDLPGKDSKKRVTLSITHVESEEKDGDKGDEAGEDAEEEKKETPAAEADEEKDEPETDEPDANAPRKGNKAPVSVKDSGLDEED